MMKPCSVCKKANPTAFKACEPCRALNRARVARRYAKVGMWRTPEQNRAHVAAWGKANPDKLRVQHRHQQARRRAVIRNTQVAPFTQEQLAQRLSMYAKCWMCGTSDWDEIDHVKPIAKGGPHILANLRPACRSCNRSKSATWPL